MKLLLTKMKMPEGVKERWRKVYRGKTYYFRGDYSRCVIRWEQLKRELKIKSVVDAYGYIHIRESDGKKLKLTRCPRKQSKAAHTPKWRKMYEGKLYYFRGEYEDALQQWKDALKKLKKGEEVITEFERRKKEIEFCCEIGDRIGKPYDWVRRKLRAWFG